MCILLVSMYYSNLGHSRLHIIEQDTYCCSMLLLLKHTRAIEHVVNDQYSSLRDSKPFVNTLHYCSYIISFLPIFPFLFYMVVFTKNFKNGSTKWIKKNRWDKTGLNFWGWLWHNLLRLPKPCFHMDMWALGHEIWTAVYLYCIPMCVAGISKLAYKHKRKRNRLCCM